MTKRVWLGLGLAALAALSIACNTPTQPDETQPKTSTTSVEAVPGGAAPSGYVRVNHSVGTEKPTYENVDRNRPGKLFERDETKPIPPRATVGATSITPMPLRCSIWYVTAGRAWLIIHREGEHTSAVICTMTPQLYTSETKKAGRDIPKDCKCTPGTDTIVLLVEWDHE